MNRTIHANGHSTDIETFDNVTRQVRFLIDEDSLWQDGLINSHHGKDYGWDGLAEALITTAQYIVEQDSWGLEWDLEDAYFDDFYTVYRVNFVAL